MLSCLCGDLTLWSSFLLDSFIFRVGEVVCIYVSKYLVVEMELKYLLLISCTRRGLFESGQG